MILQGVKLKKSEENKFLEIYLSVQENGKKNDFWKFFQLLEINEKYIYIYIYNEKRKKNLCRSELGYCPNYIARE